jgi:1,4-dihydroxy-2-naphthoyl-CoA hydrolase
MDMLTQLRDRMPFAKSLGIELVSVTAEKIVATLAVREDLCTAQSMVHGGVIMAFADTLGAAGTIVNLAEGAGTATIESKTNFVAPASVGMRLTGEAVPVHRGRRTQIWQTRITTESGKLVALVTQTQMVF